jgi:pimeloyl-ACP methyl ester carboxylesterase
LVGTSVSGITVAHAADSVPDRIGHLVFIEALLPLPGEIVADLITATPIPDGVTRWESTKLAYGPSREFLEGNLLKDKDLDPETRAWAVPRFTMFPKSATPRVAPPTDFWNKSWSATIINCRFSANPSEAHQRRSAEKLKAAFFELDAGHYPMLSHPEELAEILMQ